MATIRKHRSKYQVQIRRQGQANFSKSFHNLRDAKEWARYAESLADRGELPQRTNKLKRITLRDLVERYLGLITPTKKGA
ncbi:MAG: site-specific integrase, partial [Rhizobiaceae bacterium]